MDEDAKAIQLGHPSYVWRFGQDRRLALIARYARLDGARILDVGCGLGTYVRKLRRFSEEVYGVDVDADRVAEASQTLPNIACAPAEKLPFDDGFFDTVLLHEVLEHVNDDRQAMSEACRVLRVGGRAVIFVPNRLYPFETHGAYWGGRYHFGNIPLIGYLPNALRRRLVPHVRAYTARELHRLLDGLPCRIVVHTQIFPGYDNIAHRYPRLAQVLRSLTYALEKTPLRALGLSHLLVVEKTG
ncbi:MAG: methyltransferase domain-containing protein [Chloroflexi bacterium]|nr:methyltransferase domain-containing protein [Chloroflexota bacterium]